MTFQQILSKILFPSNILRSDNEPIYVYWRCCVSEYEIISCQILVQPYKVYFNMHYAYTHLHTLWIWYPPLHPLLQWRWTRRNSKVWPPWAPAKWMPSRPRKNTTMYSMLSISCFLVLYHLVWTTRPCRLELVHEWQGRIKFIAKTEFYGSFKKIFFN